MNSSRNDVKIHIALPNAQRRMLMKLGLGSIALTTFFGRAVAAPLAAAKPDTEVTVDLFSPAGKLDKTVRVPKLVKADADWRKQLSEASYLVTRKAGKERPFTGKDWDNHKNGLYRCICCDTAVFDSRTKFESGTGWPSFWQPISAANMVSEPDRSFGVQRTAVACRLCDAHLGHVFRDGPKPTGLRYCMNSAAMRFVARA